MIMSVLFMVLAICHSFAGSEAAHFWGALTVSTVYGCTHTIVTALERNK